MGGQFLADGVWLGSEFFGPGTSREQMGDLAGRVGAHLWTERGPSVPVDTRRAVDVSRLVGVASAAFEAAPSGTGLDAAVRAVVDDLGFAADEPPAFTEVPSEQAEEVPDFVAVPVVEEPTPVADPEPEPEPEPEPVEVVDEAPPLTPGGEAFTSAPKSEIPPRSGPGSSKAVWAEFARSQNVSVDPGASRDDIIRDLEDAGIDLTD